jgi:hypothetical protein
LLPPFPFSFIPLFLIHLYSSIHSSPADPLLIHFCFPRQNPVSRTQCMTLRTPLSNFRPTLIFPSSKFWAYIKCSQLHPIIRTPSLFPPWNKKIVCSYFIDAKKINSDYAVKIVQL